MSSIRALNLVAVLLLFVAMGCQQSETNGSASAPAQVSEITDPQTGATLVVEISQSKMDLTESLQITMKTAWKPGVKVELITPNWSEAGWDYTELNTSEITFDGSSFTQTHQTQLSAFLDGQYIIPSIGIRSETQDAGRRIARLQEIPITVTSMLDTQDDGTLDSSVGFLEPPETEPASSNAWIIALGGFGVLIIISAIVIHRRMHSTADIEARDPSETLSRIARSASSSDEVLCELHQALLDLNLKTPDFQRLTESVEATRYSNAQTDAQWVQSTAKQALKLSGGSA